MKSKQSYLVFAAVLLLLFGLIVLALLGVQVLRQRQEQAKMKYQPPVVQITAPLSEVSIPVGSYISAESTIAFSLENPVQTVEWYLDGVLAESHPLQPKDGVSQAYDSYSSLIPTEGPHMLVARAINVRGVVGKSLPLTFQGVAKGDAFYGVTMSEEDTLESIASNNGSNIDTLQSLNPGLTSSPPAGSTIKVPIPPENEPPSSPKTPPTASSNKLVSTSPMLKAANIPSNMLSLLVAAPPKAPTNLHGEVKDCKVKLVWEDNAVNESGYEVWMAAPGAPLIRLATLQPSSGGAAWTEFKSPSPGYFLFWVEAVNALGQQGSNVINLNVDSGCQADAATHLQVEILDITVNGSADRVYCYVSLENALEVRLPAYDGNFIAIQGGQGNVTAWPHTFSIPIPKNDKLKISGECWGWSGNSLNKIGDFNGLFAKTTWDGKKYLINAGNAKIGVTVNFLGQTGKKWTFSERSPGFPGINSPNSFLYDLPVNPNLTPPSNLSKADIVDPTPPHFRWVILYWDHNAGPSDSGVDGFSIYLNGTLFKTIDSYSVGGGSARYERDATMLLPLDMTCGKHMRWEVAANAGPAQSRLSDPLEYDLPPCDVYAMVEFLDINLRCTADDGGYFKPDCLNIGWLTDNLEAYFNLSVNNTTQSHWGGNFFIPIEAGTIKFSDIGAYYWKPFPDTIVVPILEDTFEIDIRTRFWDHDSDSPDDDFGSHRIDLYYDLEGAKTDLGCGKIITNSNTHTTGTAISTNLRVKVTLFPNDCSKSPPFGEYKWMNPSGTNKADLGIYEYTNPNPKFFVNIVNSGPNWLDTDVNLNCIGIAKWTDASGVLFTKTLAPGTKKIHINLKKGDSLPFFTGIKIEPSYSNVTFVCNITMLDIDPDPENNKLTKNWER